ncbi:MAG TPA: NADH-quinone oxidoreductase subunit J [Armatimonadota bacterium]|nr:NADH-quinone oxidoreductase subunit J [Armatimonadota bacterium]
MIVIWLLIAFVALTSALLVIVLDNPVHSALSLVVTLLSVACFYAMLLAPFVAIVQVVIYAGAIMVLFLFVIMLLNLHREEGGVRAKPWVRYLAILFGLLTAGSLCIAVVNSTVHDAKIANVYQFGSPQQIGFSLFRVYLLPFEITSLLLTVALVGAILLARRKF